MNSSPASSQISRSSSPASARMPQPGLLEPRGVELDPRLLGLAQHVHERQLDLAQQVLEAALAHLLALAAGELVREHGARGLGIVGVDGHAALLAELLERVAAARGVEQVGGDLGVPGQVGRDLAERLRVVRDHGAVARRRDQLGRVGDLAGERVRPAGVGAEAPAARARQQLALGHLGRGRDQRQLGAGQAREVGRGALAHRDGAGGLGLRARDRGRLGRVERLLEPAQRVAQLEVAEDRAQPRAVALARQLGRRGRGRPGRRAPSSPAAWRCARPRRTRSGSACAWRRRSGRRSRARSSSEPKRCSSSAAVLSPMPGTPGMLSDVSPLRPMKSGTSSGGIP